MLITVNKDNDVNFYFIAIKIFSLTIIIHSNSLDTRYDYMFISHIFLLTKYTLRIHLKRKYALRNFVLFFILKLITKLQFCFIPIRVKQYKKYKLLSHNKMELNFWNNFYLGILIFFLKMINCSNN